MTGNSSANTVVTSIYYYSCYKILNDKPYNFYNTITIFQHQKFFDIDYCGTWYSLFTNQDSR